MAPAIDIGMVAVISTLVWLIFAPQTAHLDYCKTSRPYIGHKILAESRLHGVKSSLALAVMEVESTWNVNAERIERGGRTKSIGLFQLYYPTAVEMERKRGSNRVRSFADLRDVDVNVELGVEHLAKCERKFHDLSRVLCCYNAGPYAKAAACESEWVQNYERKFRLAVRKYHRSRI